MTTPVDDLEFPNSNATIEVATWRYNAAISYGSLDDVHKTQVTELWWYKHVEGLEHEYVVATCHRDGVVDNIILRLERRPSVAARNLVVAENTLPPGTIEGLSSGQYRSIKADAKAERDILEKTRWTALQKTAAKKGKDLDSVDTVTRLSGPESFLTKEERLLWNYHSFRPGKPFYVRDLALLADAVHQHEPKYRFFVNQCYWYARTLVNVAVDVYGPSITDGPDWEEAGTYTVGKGSKIGFRITVSRDCQNEVDEIRKAFEGAVKDHNEKVDKKHYEQVRKPREELRKEQQGIEQVEEELATVGLEQGRQRD